LLPYDPTADAVVLIEQLRLPALAAGLDPVLLEIPAGLADRPESAETTAVRETQEEAGLVPDRVLPIGEIMLLPGGCDEVCSLFMGRVRVPATSAAGIGGLYGLASESEDIRVVVWPAAEAIEAALAGKLPNVLTMLALLWFAARRDWLRQEWART
jgi:ADP-ribose pyrophosphatase